MAEKPNEFPDWATGEQTDPVSGQTNRVQPPAGQQVSGWTRREIPPRQWWNWNQWTNSRWLRWLDERENRPQVYTSATLPPAVEEGEGKLALFLGVGGELALLVSTGTSWETISGEATVGGFRWVTPYMFGAVGDGEADDTQAFLDAIAADAATLYIPEGRFLLKEKMSFGAGPKAILGDGQFKSWLIWAGEGVVGRGIEVVHQDHWDMTTISGLTLETDASGTVEETAIFIDHSVPRENTFPMRADPVAVVEDVNIVGVVEEDDGFLSSGWWRGVWTVEAPLVALDRVNFFGDRDGDFDSIASETAFLIEGGEGVTDQTVTACQAFNARTCLRVRGDVEGVRVTDCTFISADIGIHYEESVSPYLSVQGTHTNCQEKAVFLESGTAQAIIDGNLFYVFGSGNRIGIDAPGMSNSNISDNIFIDVGSGGTATGIVLRDAAHRNIITGNKFQALDTGLELQSTTGERNYAKNNYTTGDGALYVNNSERSLTYPAFVTVFYTIATDPSISVASDPDIDFTGGKIIDFYGVTGGQSAWWLEGTFRSRVRAPADGWYRVSYRLQWESIGAGESGAGWFFSRIILNGDKKGAEELDLFLPHDTDGIPAGTGGSLFQGGTSGPIFLNRSDFVEVQVDQRNDDGLFKDVLGASLTLENLD